MSKISKRNICLFFKIGWSDLLWLPDQPLWPGDCCAFCAQTRPHWCVSIMFKGTLNSKILYVIKPLEMKDSRFKVQGSLLVESKTVSCKREQGAERVNSYRVCVKCCGHWTAALAAQLPCIQCNLMFYIIKWQNIFTLASVFCVQKIWVFVCQIQLMLPRTWL